MNSRVIGSKIQLAGWTTAPCLLWTLKLCVTFFYFRLTVRVPVIQPSGSLLMQIAQNGLGTYQKRIHVAMLLNVTSFVVVIMTIFLSCMPFNHYWQVSPDPGNSCQPAISMPIIWVTFVSNVSTDIFLFFIPIPMLWKSSLRLYKKVATTSVLSAGLLIIICATLKSIYVIVVGTVFILSSPLLHCCILKKTGFISVKTQLGIPLTSPQDPVNGGQLAAEWGTRETFIAVVTTNLPMIFPLFKVWFAPFLPSTLRSGSNNKAYKSPGSGFVTIGGGGASSHVKETPRNGILISANLTFDNESEERIIEECTDVKMQDLNNTTGSQRPQGAIIVSKQVSVTTEEFSSEGAFRQV